MCGRLTLRLTPTEVASLLDAIPDESVREARAVPRYNIAPSQDVLTLRQGEAGPRSASMLKWGLVPSWIKDLKTWKPLINARSETAATKNAFRYAFKKQRCAVPVDGFYEWKRGEQKSLPFHFAFEKDAPFALAGLWEKWKSDAGTLETFCLLTTEPNELLTAIEHDRMPVILEGEQLTAWLDPHIDSADLVQKLITTHSPVGMKSAPASLLVNRAGYEHPDCLDPNASPPLNQAEKPKPKRKRKEESSTISDESDTPKLVQGTFDWD